MTGDRVDCLRLAAVLGGVDVLRADFRRQSFAPHFHDDHTFGLVTRGANRFRYGRERLVAPAGTICLAMPGEIHTGEAIEDGWSYWTLHIAPIELDRLAAEAGGGAAFARGVIADAPAALRFARFFGALGNDGPLGDETRLIEALGYLARGHGTHRPRPIGGGDRTVAARVRSILADRIDEPVTLADLEAETGIGRFRLIRAFRAAFGLPPHGWQRQARLERARALILAGAPIAAAAAQTGFADQAHMTRLFRRAYGHTPGALVAGRRAA